MTIVRAVLVAAFVVVATVTELAHAQQQTGLLFCDGDSQTMRRPPLTAGQPWCEILTARRGQNEVHNFASSGATSGACVGCQPGNNVLARLPQHFALGHGNCLALMIGINDA